MLCLRYGAFNERGGHRPPSHPPTRATAIKRRQASVFFSVVSLSTNKFSMTHRRYWIRGASSLLLRARVSCVPGVVCKDGRACLIACVLVSFGVALRRR